MGTAASWGGKRRNSISNGTPRSPSAWCPEPASASHSYCPVILWDEQHIQNTPSHICHLSLGNSGLEFSAGVMFYSLRTSLLQFSPERLCESTWAFRGLFLLCFASMHFQSITWPTWCGTLWQIDALSNTVWNFQLSFFSSGLSSTSCVIFKVFLFSIIHTLREEVPDFPGAAVLELQDRVSVVWNACSLGCGIWQGSLSVFRWEGAGSSALFQCSPSGGRLGNVIGRQVFQSGGGWKWKHLKHCLGMKLCCGKSGFQYDSFCRVRWKYNVDM